MSEENETRRTARLDNATLPTLPHHIAPHPPQPQPISHSRSSHSQPPPPQLNLSPSSQQEASDRSVHRTDTMPASSQGVSPGGAQLLSFSNRDQQPLRPSPSSFSPSGARHSPTHESIRSQLSLHAIATLPRGNEDAASVPASSSEALTVPRSKIDVMISYVVSILLSVSVLTSTSQLLDFIVTFRVH
jgi:hypothetical protein